MTTKDPIFEVQEYLRYLAKNGYQLPLIVPDGIYGDNTRSAVGVFQSLVGLPVTGRVDYVTWQALVAAHEEAREINARSTPIYPFDEILEEELIREGDALPLVYIIQIILRTIGVAYQNLEMQALTGVYDSDTVRNVSDFQRVNGIPITGQVNKETWNRLAEAYNKYINRG